MLDGNDEALGYAADAMLRCLLLTEAALPLRQQLVELLTRLGELELIHGSFHRATEALPRSA